MRRTFRKLAAASLSGALILGNITVSYAETEGTTEISAELTDSSEADALTDTALSLLKSHGSEEGKEETVYVITDADGNVEKTIVSAWLKNPDEKDTLEDVSDLSDITNVKGDETFTQGENGSITWQADGNDIYYQGTSTKELPISTAISYNLDGKEVTASELSHASGHLVMTFHYTNNTAAERTVNGETVTMYQPFAVVSGTMFNNDRVSNVTVTNGISVNTGDMTFVVGLALPGLSQSLGLDTLTDSNGNPIQINIPESVTIEADVSDFSLLTIITVADDNLLKKIDFDDEDALVQISDSLDELTEDSAELLEESVNAGDAANEDSADKDSENKDSGDKTVPASDESGISGVVSALKTGVDTLSSGAEQLADGADAIQSAADQVADGADSLYKAITSKTGALSLGFSALTFGVKKVKTGLDTYLISDEQSIYNVADGIVQYADGLSSGFSETAQSISDASTAAASAAEGVSQAAEGISSVETALTSTGDSISSAETSLTAAYEALAGMDTDNLTQEQKDALSAAMEALAGEKGAKAELEEAGSVLSEASSQAAALSTAADSLKTAADGLSQYSQGISEAGTSMEEAISSIKTCAEGIETTAQTLDSADEDIMKGLDSVSSGVSTIQSSLESSAKTYIKSGDTSSEDKYGLYEAAKAISDGAAQISAGLKSGDSENPGMYEGIQELASGCEAVQTLIDRLKELKAYSEEYTSFSGTADAETSSVRFIMRTDSIGE